MLGATGCSNHLESANRFFAGGQYEKAEIEFLNVLRKNPNDPAANERIGTIYFEQGKAGRAFAFLSKAKELQPKNLEVRLKLGSLYLAGRKVKEAQGEAEFVLAQQPNLDEALILLADTAVSSNLLVQVRQQLERFRAPAGNKAGFHVALGTLAWRQRNSKEAESEFRQALGQDTKSAAALFALGSVLAAQTNLAGAEQAFKAAAELSPIRSSRRLAYAEFKLKTGGREEGKQILEALNKQAPDYVPAGNFLAQLAFDEKKYDECSAWLKKVLAHDAGNFEAIVLGSRIHIVQGEPAKALMELERLKTMYPNVPQVHYQLGLAHLLNKDLDKAIESLNQALVLDPNAVDALYLLSQIQVAKGDSASAISKLTAYLKQRPEDERGQLLLARAYSGQGRLDDSLAIYRSLIKLPGRHSEPALLAGLILRQQNKLSEARLLFEKAADVPADSLSLSNQVYLQAVNQIVELDIVEKKFDAATQRVQSLLGKFPRSPEPEFLLARVYAGKGDQAHEEAALLKTIELDPTFRNAYLSLARLYVSSKRQQQALAKLEEGLTRNPKDIMALLLIATIHAQSANYAKAGEAYERLLAVNPQYGPALNNYAYLCSEQLGQLEKAFQLSQKARAAFPQDPATADTLGWIQYRRGNYSAALPLIQEAAEKLPADPEVQYHLGMAHYMLGEAESARTTLQRSLQLSTNFVGRIEAQQRLALLTPNAADARTIPELEKELNQQPNDSILLLRLAGLYEQQASWDKAKAAYEKVFNSNARSAPAAAGLARLYAAHFQDLPKALEFAKKARDLAPDDPRLAHLLGRLLYQSGDHRWALSLLQESARSLPNEPALWYDLAWAQFSNGRPKDAEASMQRVLQLAGASVQAGEAKRFLALCSLCSNPGATVPAAAQIQEALQADSKYAPALVAAALLCQQQTNVPAARVAWEKVLGAVPAYVPADVQLAALYAEAPADYQKAYDHALKARTALPDDPGVARTLGIISYQRRDYARAAQLLSESSRKFSSDADLFFYLGMSQFQLHQTGESKAALQKALALNLNPSQAIEAKKTLATMP
jgi:tetratricopeptide (TPR) repeat protein